MPGIGKKQKLDMLRTLITIRRFEEKTTEMYEGGEFGGYFHPYIGQEAVAVGACAAIRPSDYIVSTHRGHGHCIAKGGDLDRMMAEILGRSTGYCKGRGGSMHISDSELRMLGANGIVGGGIPISVGAGFSCKRSKLDEAVLCFFGDGAANNGVFHEALNMAAIFKLPVIFICENNLYAISMCSLDSVAGKDVGKRACAYDIPGYIIDGSDVIKVYDTVKEAVDHAREGMGPSLIEAKTYRFYGHHPNDPALYRTEKESSFHRQNKDPVALFEEKLLNEKVLTEKDIEDIESEVKKKVDKSYKFAVNSPGPDVELFLEGE